jgi:hypothetical protein
MESFACHAITSGKETLTDANAMRNRAGFNCCKVNRLFEISTREVTLCRPAFVSMERCSPNDPKGYHIEP